MLKDDSPRKLFNVKINIDFLSADGRLGRIAAEIESGDYKSAIRILEKNVIKYVDGCATVGYPDKNDKILTCEAQLDVYSDLTEALERLKAAGHTGATGRYYKDD